MTGTDSNCLRTILNYNIYEIDLVWYHFWYATNLEKIRVADVLSFWLSRTMRDDYFSCCVHLDPIHPCQKHIRKDGVRPIRMPPSRFCFFISLHMSGPVFSIEMASAAPYSPDSAIITVYIPWMYENQSNVCLNDSLKYNPAATPVVLLLGQPAYMPAVFETELPSTS